MPVASWVVPNTERVFPQSPARRGPAHPALEGALNERMSFQVAVRGDEPSPVNVSLAVDGPAGWRIRVRRVGYVPLPHHNTPVMADPLDMDGLGHTPGFVPDPLFDESSVLLPGGETHAFWVSLQPGRGAAPGVHSLKVRVEAGGAKPAAHSVKVRLHDVALEKRKGFSVTHWFYADSIMDWYKTDGMDERFWTILESYARNVAEHGQDTLYVPVFTPPLDGVKRPTQLLGVRRAARGRYLFDWRDVRRYVRMAGAAGVRKFEWCHPFTQWGVKNAIRIYEDRGRDERLLWKPETGATSPVYRAFLAQYLPELRRFMDEEGIAKRSFFHVSDEPHGDHIDDYRKARAMLAELAPWMKVMDALSSIDFAKAGLTDLPVPSISTALSFAAEGIPSWCYYCCGPRERYLQRLMDTPLAKIAMHGLMFYRWPFKGFLHWGYNYWYRSQTRKMIDPYAVSDGLQWPGWAYGDTFVVYPGPDGPVDSIRWEVFGESLQDYQLLQTLGVSRSDRRLSAIRSFEDFPKNAAWRAKLRSALLSGAGRRASGERR